MKCEKCGMTWDCECLRCGHRWSLRGKKAPKVCSKCKSPYWAKPRQK